jgi:hypothetical protein
MQSARARQIRQLQRAWALQIKGYEKLESREDAMPIKPNGLLCEIREQIIEDLASGLILQFECTDGRVRLIIAGKSLPFGNREILFDAQGREAAAGTLLGEFRRPSSLKKV